MSLLLVSSVTPFASESSLYDFNSFVFLEVCLGAQLYVSCGVWDILFTRI